MLLRRKSVGKVDFKSVKLKIVLFLFFQGTGSRAHGLWSLGSVNVMHGFSCPVACGIFPDQGLNPCPLH